MYKILGILICLLIAFANPKVSYSAKDISAEDFFGGKPLMVVRFNQANVYYQLPLYRAVKRALQIYPNASFQIVSVFPSTGDFKTDERASQKANLYAEQVVLALDDMGLPSTRYRTNYTSNSANEHHEVHLFVR